LANARGSFNAWRRQVKRKDRVQVDQVEIAGTQML
jgi:hypothetical protein